MTEQQQGDDDSDSSSSLIVLFGDTGPLELESFWRDDYSPNTPNNIRRPATISKKGPSSRSRKVRKKKQSGSKLQKHVGDDGLLQEEEEGPNDDSSSDNNKAPKCWTSEEDELLGKLKIDDGLGWEKIAQMFPDRTATGCRDRWNKRLKYRYYNQKLKSGGNKNNMETEESSTHASNKRHKSESSRSSWLPGEDDLICKFKRDGLQWADIAEKIPGKNPDSCQNRWNNYLKHHLEAVGGNNRTKFSNWKLTEDDLLNKLRDDGLQWAEIAEKLPGRTDKSCQNRWYSLGRKKKLEKNDRKDLSWTPREDSLLCKLIKEGLQWAEITKKIPGRNFDSCQKRWNNHLRHNIDEIEYGKTTKGNSWKPEEEVILMKSRSDGLEWTEIAEKLPGRTDRSCQNRWYVIRKKMQDDCCSSDMNLADEAGLIEEVEATENALSEEVEVAEAALLCSEECVV